MEELLFSWRKMSGPDGEFIENAGGAVTDVDFSNAGSYTLVFEVLETRDEDSDSAEIRIEVEPEPEPEPPVPSATLNWQEPGENDDGSELLDLAGFRVYYGLCTSDGGDCGDPLNQEQPLVEDVGLVTTATLDDLTSGRTYYFYVTAYTFDGIESGASATAFKTFPP